MYKYDGEYFEVDEAITLLSTFTLGYDYFVVIFQSKKYQMV